MQNTVESLETSFSQGLGTPPRFLYLASQSGAEGWGGATAGSKGDGTYLQGSWLWGQTSLFPAPGLAWLSLEGTVRGSTGSQENLDLVIQPSGKFSPLSGQLFFPPPFLLKIIEMPRRGFFPHPPAGGGGALPLAQAPVIAGTPPGPGPAPTPTPRGSSYSNCSHCSSSFCGRNL